MPHINHPATSSVGLCRVRRAHHGACDAPYQKRPKWRGERSEGPESVEIKCFTHSQHILNMKKPSLQQRLKAKNRSQAMIVGLTWYTEETWSEVKTSASDPEGFEDSFLKWKTMAISTRRDFQRSGVRTIEFQIIPQEFFAWCVLNDRKNDSSARAEFVAERLSAAAEAGA